MFDADESACRVLPLVNGVYFGAVDDNEYVDDGGRCVHRLEDISSRVVS